ncbi:TPA: hypothetical protein U5E31_002202 [Yersinia enterocolitica]|uniref:hypothetical protein n=1 Tax=Yersinia enterocolitica TaxID=630 RepID=UPI00094BA435|nr:hypothetical protein [Yersinia enterocolitica]HDL8054838.1 hypothetical protein [Yersinia enterocolitica]HEI6852425.1 hypothetical protein [Yersinia enterocolitica]HEN3566997.1 hypothetical protein [Yersinia enterocolitica]HEN3571446.1 hypothetical protein [Yersinia enterocolitica]HEN3575326.1 hypothetical protein [Yersinia enterocolitica]
MSHLTKVVAAAGRRQVSDKLVVNHFEQRLRWPVGGASDEAHNPDELTKVSKRTLLTPPHSFKYEG